MDMPNVPQILLLKRNVKYIGGHIMSGGPKKLKALHIAHDTKVV